MKLMTFALILTLLAGCATKRYGRLDPVSGYEKDNMTCDQIEMELAKVDAFRERVAKEDNLNLMSAAAFLGDFGLGNTIEHNQAHESADNRERELKALRRGKGC